MANDPSDPRSLTPDQRLNDIAAILAKGIRRLLSVRAGAAPAAPQAAEQISSNSSQNGLDDSPETRLHVPRS